MLLKKNTHFMAWQKWPGLLILMLLISACSNDNSDPANPEPVSENAIQRVPLASLRLRQVNDCGELKNYISTSLIKRYASTPRYNYYNCPSGEGGGGGGRPEPVVTGIADEASLSGDASSSPPNTPDDVSDTTNQVAGVNEGDIVKTDRQGNMYILSGRHFIIAKGFPPHDLSILAKIDLGVRGLNLFLDKENQRVTILARHDEPFYITDTPSASDESLAVIYPGPRDDYTTAIFYDVSTPDKPEVIDQIQMRGNFREGRRIENRLHLVSSHYLQTDSLLYADPEFIELQKTFIDTVNTAKCDTPNDEIDNNPDVIQAQKNLGEQIEKIISATDPASYLPDAKRITDDTSEPVPYLACNNISHPEVNMSLGLQIITSIDTDGSNLAATGIINNSHIVYASKNNLYLVENSRNWWWILPNDERPTSQSAIYKFAISKDAPNYVATGRVDGYINNQFSLSEYDYDGKNMLRIATTQDDFLRIDDDSGTPDWQRVQTNHLSILEDDGNGQLNIAGEVRNFAPNENIRSARFMGERGFVVTFRNVDPLFAFDLSNPTSPVLTGELTIPGFSSYMHPYDDNHLVTIGRAGGEGGIGVGNGMQLQLVDVSDMSEPKVIHKFTPDAPQNWSWSAAEYDHKAFTFYKPANLLAIPLQISPNYSKEYFSGVAAYEITVASGFKELGRVDHSDLAFDYYCREDDSPLVYPYTEDCGNGWYVRWAAPRRSVVMTDTENVYLYTVSDIGLKAASTKDLSTTLGSIVFPPQPYPWWYYGYNGRGGVAVADPSIDVMPVAN
ncbi:MAG: hypothetical protein GXP18_07525 [Gammaproteobacteria bacterium]|nr:hypothetical protein [Gammaproteobacteria bacterium]